ncbi:MAG: glycerol-3-phosphate acyltransferase [Anaerolineae bacterium]|jgi:glycerol-3-phosphate acyltransferase PlsY
MNLTMMLVAAVAGYLVGSVSFGRVVGYFVARGQDLEDAAIRIPDSDQEMELTYVSATSIGVQKGSKWGCLAGILDILKGLLPTLVFRLGYPSAPLYFIAGVATVVGHNWPVYYRFKGGRGMSTIRGSALVVDWLGSLVSVIAGGLVSRFLIRESMFSPVVSLPLFLLWSLLVRRNWWNVGFAVAVNLAFVLASIPEYRVYQRYKREGRLAEYEAAWRAAPMFRGRARINQWLRRLIQRGCEGESNQSSQ